ncbi:glutamate--tRNA ligase [Nitratireductor basaltis]|uniref:Glutamate--tRNA ligase n=1 Tax=Nitratireductor basaltis TaxID=472175 RepID=A0A084UAW1_9HYPH|nr:glutamate--tRNA ligase [Nitratireductor basaltis]KFB10097.1 Glutamate--tRNA ligase [Nitratireductor basaltis]
MTVTLRFAPSPTGRIHIGNARTALFNWLFARKAGGRFILRFDDTDSARSTREFADEIERDLEWLGIEPDEIIRQSDRTDAHDRAAAFLREKGLLYPCYETPEELERRRKIRLSRRLPPVYGREALKLSEADRKRLEEEGRSPHWRFLLPNFKDDPHQPERTDVTWDDVVRGPQTVDLASMSDPVLIREDGTYLYTLPSVVDDIDTKVTHIIRGDDHVTNTGAQIALFEALGAQVPAFGHHNLLTATSGEGLSKRKGALSIASLREDGLEPMAVASLAVLIGASGSVEACSSMKALEERFEPSASSRSAAKFDPEELRMLSRQLVQQKPFDAVEQRLAELGITGAKAKPFWQAICGNIEKIEDAAEWWVIVEQGPSEDTPLDKADQDFVRQAFDLLPEEPWTENVWKEWTSRVKTETGRKGKQLFKPLRIALTGREWGPELSDLLPLLGREGTLARRP